MSLTGVKRKLKYDHYHSIKCSSSVNKKCLDSLTTCHYFMDCENNQDLATYSPTTSNDKMPDFTTNQRTDIQLDSVLTNLSSIELGMDETSGSESIVVIKSESMDKGNIENVQQNRTTSTSDSLNVVEDSCVRLRSLSLENKAKKIANIHHDTTNSDVQKEVFKENVTSVTCSSKPAAVGGVKKKKGRKRQFQRRNIRKELMMLESLLDDDKPIENSESLDEDEGCLQVEFGDSDTDSLDEIGDGDGKTIVIQKTSSEMKNVILAKLRYYRAEYRKKQEEEDLPLIQGFVGRFAAEVTEMIFLLLNPKDLASSSLVCKSWRDAINTNIIWRRHCKKRGWTSTLSEWSCFQKSAHLWSGPYYNQYRDEKLLPLCEQRLCFNKYMFLLKNWRERNFSTYRVKKPINQTIMLSSSTPHVPSPCDGKYVVMFDNHLKKLLVWSVEGEPYGVNCDYCQQRMDVTDIRVCFDTIAIVQGPYISVYINKGIRFEHAYIKSQFVPDNNRPHNGVVAELSKINIEMNKDYLLGCPSYQNAHAYVWDRITGDPITSITFDSNYPILNVTNLYESSIYFGRQNVRSAHKVVEYDIKQKSWSKFNIDCPQHVKQLVVNNDYICTVTSENGRRELINDVCVWNRATGAIIKSFKGFGKSYQFVNNYLVYYYNARVVVHPLDENDAPREVCLDDCITNVRPVFDHLLVLSTMGKVEVWDWMMKRKLYTVFYPKCLSMEMWVDCEKIVLLSDRNSEIVVLRF